MEVIKIEAGKRTPFVHLDYDNKIMKMSGRSMPEDAVGFYIPIIDWFKEYLKQPLKDGVLDVRLEYFNTSSSKNLLEIFKLVKDAENGNSINWHYDWEDEDMQEAGEDFIFIIGESIRLIEDNEDE